MFRDSIAREMKFVLDAATEPWGVLVERVEVKDVRWLFTCLQVGIENNENLLFRKRVPERLQKAMAAEAEAAREARAKVIAAEGEHKVRNNFKSKSHSSFS